MFLDNTEQALRASQTVEVAWSTGINLGLTSNNCVFYLENLDFPGAFKARNSCATHEVCQVIFL